MKLRLLLLGVALAGCTASEPQDLAYSPGPTMNADAPAPTDVPAIPNPTAGSQGGSTNAVTQTGTAGQAAGSANVAAGFPAPPAVEPQSGACHTVGNVTTCDVPANPGADETHYTN